MKSVTSNKHSYSGLDVRIVHTIPTIDIEAAGPTYSVVRLCTELTNTFNVSLIALKTGNLSSMPDFLRTFPFDAGPKKLGASSAMRSWLAGQGAEGKIQLIHNHSLWMMPNVYPGQIADKYGIPMLVAPRGTLSKWAMQNGSVIKKLFWPLVQHPALKSTSCFHATAYSEYEDIRRNGFKQPVAIIPNGIDIFNVVGKRSKKYRSLLFLGRIHPVKGLDMLLHAWRILQNYFPDWELQIVGPDNQGYAKTMLALSEQLGLKRVKFCGPLYANEKIQAYANADLFVLPTYSENFGVAVAESLAAGTPVVVTKGAPWEGLIEHNAGWWVDISVRGIAGGLHAAMLKSRSELVQMGGNGKNWMEREFSWQDIGERMAKVYDWVLHGGISPSCIIHD